MSQKQWDSAMAKGLPSPVYLLVAEDPYLLKEAVLAVKAAVPAAERDFRFHQFDREGAVESAPPVEQMLDVLRTVPLMGGRQVLALEGAQKLVESDLEALERYLGDPAPESVLIMLNAGNLKKAQRERLAKAALIHLDIRERDLPYWLKQRARDRGFTLTDRAVAYLMGTVGPDPGLLAAEVEKCALVGSDRVDADDVAGIVKGAGDCDVFDLTRALERRDAREAFRIHRRLAETQEPYSMLGALNWHYGRVEGVNRERIFALLAEADLRIKSSGGAYPLEDLLIRLLRL
jgi:DNA polymerase III delta subunit